MEAPQLTTPVDLEPPDHTEEGAEQLSSLVRRGLGWSLASNVLSRLGTLVSGIVLARILDPADYGTFTVAMVALVLIANVNDLGLEPTLVRWPRKIDDIAPTAMTMTMGSSLLLYAAVFAAAPPFSALLGAPHATNLVRVMALGVIVNGIFAVSSASLTRSFDQRGRTVADLSGFVLGTGLTISLALAGLGPWSLVWGRLAGNALNSGLYWVFAEHRYRPRWNPDVARELLRAGLPLAGTSLLAVAALNVDYIVVGQIAGSVQLGLYLMAFNLSSWPVNMFAIAVARVSVAGFARLQHDVERLRAAFLRTFILLMVVTVPVSVLLSTLGGPLISFVYGDKWHAAAAALRWLALLGGIRVAFQLASDVLVAVGRGKTTLVVQATWIAVLVPGLVVGTRIGGIKGTGVAHIVVAVVIVGPVVLHALASIGLSFGTLARSVARVAVGGIAAAFAAVTALQLPGGDFVHLATGGVAGLASCAVFVAPLRHVLRPAPEVDAVSDVLR
jgi:PST family polysaccharide transporter